jgi:uroporphyrinogen-III synthase
MAEGSERDEMGDEAPARTRSFNGLRVAAFESRRAAETARLLESAGAVAYVSPTMREVALEQNPALVEFAQRLIAGDYDVVVLMTGVGFRLMLSRLREAVDEATFLGALGRTTTVARGPKPVAALHEAGLSPSVRIGEPNTWRDILDACRRSAPDVRNARIALQEHGQPSTDLRAGLEALGATVDSVPVYEWALPDDIEPLRANLKRIVEGKIDMALFTSSRQVVHVLKVASDLGLEAKVRDAMTSITIGSIGPTTSETLRECGLHVDFEPEHPRLGHLVAHAASVAAQRRTSSES